MLKKLRSRIKITSRLQANTGQEKQKMTYSRLGFPSGVASSVVQDNTPNNLGLGVTNILRILQTI